MPDLPNTNQPVATQKTTTASSLSPWDEPLPEEKQEPKVMGTLGEDPVPAPVEKSAPFALPENPEQNVVPKMMSPDDLPEIKPEPEPEPEPEPLSPAMVATDNAVSQSVDSKDGRLNEHTKAIRKPETSLANKPALIKQKPFSNLLSLLSKSSAKSPSQPIEKKADADSKSLKDIKLAPELPETKTTIIIPKPVENRPKPAISGDIGVNKTIQTPKLDEIPVVYSDDEVGINDSVDDTTIKKPNPSAVKPARKKITLNIPPKKLWLAGSVAGVVIIFFFCVLLTEQGFLSIGLENFYGAFKLETLWGGLPRNGEIALAESFAKMGSNPNFNINGTVVVDIDRTKDSSVTSPLVSYFPDLMINNSVIKARLADVTGYDAGSGIVSSTDTTGNTTTDSSTNSDSSATSTDSSAVSSSVSGSTSVDTGNSTTTPSDTSTATDTTGSAAATDTQSSAAQSDFPAYQSITPTIRELSANVTGSITSDGGSAKFTFDKPIGSTDVSVKQSGKNLWVKSQMKFSPNHNPAKWMAFTLGKLKTDGNSVAETLFSADPSAGLSAVGTRVGNEKVGSVRTYHYKFSSMEIGDSLNSLGITGGMVDSVSGDFWIGVKDKMVHKAELKITLAPSYSVSMIQLSINLDGFGQSTFDAPMKSETLAASSATSSTSTTPASTTTAATDLAKTRDNQRRSDLKSVADALASYKTKNSNYPVAASLVKLNASGNSLAKVLASGYIPSLPKDPQDSLGWYYGYKSDGKTFTLSARMEESAADTTQSGGINLYYLANQ